MRIIAFVDGSSYGASVCDHAAWAAAGTGVELVEIFHMLGRRDRPSAPADLSGSLNLGARTALLDELAQADAERAKLAQARGRVILDEARNRLTAAGVAQVETRMRNDDIVNTVREFETDAAMVVIGKRGEASGFAHDHLGSNLERILRSASRPVLVASRAFRPIKKCLIAYDGGTSIAHALDHLANASLFADVSCHLLHVGADTRETRNRMEAAIAPLRAAGREVKVEIASGEPETAIAATVERAGIDILVAGAYGHSRIRNLIIGSTTTALVRACKVPVLMVR